MPCVEVYDGNLEAALVAFKRRVNDAHILSEYKRTMYYIPASKIRRDAVRRKRMRREAKLRRERAYAN